MPRFSVKKFAIASAVALSAMLAASAVQARTCAQVQTDINAQIKARNFYNGQLGAERNPQRRAQLIRGIQGFDRNIAILRAERCTNVVVRPNPPAVNNPYGGGPVRNPPIVRTPPRQPVGCPPGRRMGYDGLTGENRCF